MSKGKFKNSIWAVLFEGIKIYFSNIDKFVIYMLFPVFGQILGIALSFGLTLGFADRIAQKTDSISSALLFIFLLAVPGLLIFIKAFWDYMVAYVALSSMTEGAISTGRVYDFESHREVATRRSGKYIMFLLVVGILSGAAILCSIVPIFGLIPPLIIWIYLILIFQVFTFEPELSISDSFRKSFALIKGNWARTFLLMAILTFFSIYIITEGSTVIFDYLRLTEPITSNFDFIGKSLPLDYVNKALAYVNLPIITVKYISKTIFVTILSIIISELTLPIRSICWSLWYITLSELKQKEFQQSQPKKSKRQKESE